MADGISIVSLAERASWDEAHRRDGLPSQSWGYCWALSASGVDPKLAVVDAEGARMLMVFHEREWHGTTDVTTVLGLSGASISNDSPAPLALWREYAASQGWIAGYVQLAPTFETAAVPDGDELVESNTVFLLDVRKDLAKSAARTVRTKVRKADDLGIELEQDQAVLADALERLYPDSYRRRGASGVYDFDPSTLRRWALDENSLAVGARQGEVIESVAVAHVAGSFAEYHTSAGTEAGRDFDAWLLVQSARRLRDLGVDWLNIGGGITPGDGVYEYKARFHGVRKPLRSVRQIYDRATYDRLCDEAGVGGDAARFPAYRGARRATA